MSTSGSEHSSAQLLASLSQVSSGEARSLEKGTTLIDAGAPETPLLLLEEGQVDIITTEGVVTLEAPTVIGEQSLLSGAPTNARVVAKTDARVQEVQPDKLWELVRADSIGRELLQSLSRLNAERLRGKFHPEPYIALIAHDGRKDDLIQAASDFRSYLEGKPLLSTEHTSQRVEAELGLGASRVVRSGPRGGDQEVGTLVVEGLVEAVFFFPDPLTSQPHFMDVGALQRVCDVCHVPLATNCGSARHLFTSLSAESQR